MAADAPDNKQPILPMVYLFFAHTNPEDRHEALKLAKDAYRVYESLKKQTSEQVTDNGLILVYNVYFLNS